MTGSAHRHHSSKHSCRGIQESRRAGDSEFGHYLSAGLALGMCRPAGSRRRLAESGVCLLFVSKWPEAYTETKPWRLKLKKLTAQLRRWIGLLGFYKRCIVRIIWGPTEGREVQLEKQHSFLSYVAQASFLPRYCGVERLCIHSVAGYGAICAWYRLISDSGTPKRIAAS